MKLFGTDGVRGSYGKFPMDNLTIKKIGLAVSRVLHKNINNIYIAHDGRESYKSVYENLLEGLLFEKVYTIKYLGMLPTPALPYLLSSDKKQDSIGIQITASHNPYYDNEKILESAPLEQSIAIFIFFLNLIFEINFSER